MTVPKWVERRYKATAYVTPPQLKALSTLLDPDEIKGMVVISTFPDDDIEVTWADLAGDVYTRTIDTDGEIR